MKFKKIGTVGLALTGLLLVTACGNDQKTASSETSGETELTVTTWNYDKSPEFKVLVEAFEKAYPDIKVKPIDIASDDYDTKLTTMLSSGDTTDVLTMKNLLSYSNYALRDQLVDLTAHLQEIDTEPAADSYKMYEIDGKTYSQPFRTDFWMLYYNKQKFDEAGVAYPENWTWEDYAANAEKLSPKDGQVFGTYQHTWRSTIQAIAAAQNDADLMKPQYEFMTDYYERGVKLQEDNAQMPFGTAKSTKVTYNSQFEEEKTAMMYMGSWYIGALRENKEAGKTNVEWGLAPMPQLKADGKITTFGSPTSFAINKSAKNKEAAQTFLDFASGEEGAKALAAAGVVPAYRTDEINELYLSQAGMPTDEVSKKAFAPDTIAIEFPVDVNGPAVDKILQEEHDLIMTGDKTPAEGVASMEKRVKNEVE